MRNKMKVTGNIKVAGVYAILEKESGITRYVGSGINVNDSLSRHLHYLKRGLYAGTNKQILQELYDVEELEFIVLHESEHNSEVADMGKKQKENLQLALGTLEEMYIGLYKNTVCNSHKSVTKHTSNKNGVSTYRRRQANLGEKNPNSKYSLEVIENILWLKMNGYKPKNIMKMLEENGIDIKSNYISNIGVTKWIQAEAKRPNWLESEVV